LLRVAAVLAVGLNQVVGLAVAVAEPVGIELEVFQ
jgi:hypothetical protein